MSSSTGEARRMSTLILVTVALIVAADVSVTCECDETLRALRGEGFGRS